jgi:leader peptidase (prepilin peptidase)/N-methyltransferase
MNGFGLAVCTIVGFVTGSFLTVVTSRVPEGLSIVTPGSRCPSCASPLRGVDNLPVVSYLLRRGHCRSCGTHIPARYLALELGTGAAFALVAARVGTPAAVPALLVLTAGSIAAATIDISYRRIPAPVVYVTAAIGVPLLVGASIYTHRAGALVTAAVAAAVTLAVFFTIFLLAPKGLGFGDVRFAPLCAGFLGWFGWRVAAVGIVSGILLAGCYGVGMLVSGKGGRKTAIPLGPFLAAGCYLGIVAGAPIASVWLR